MKFLKAKAQPVVHLLRAKALASLLRLTEAYRSTIWDANVFVLAEARLVPDFVRVGLQTRSLRLVVAHPSR